MFKKRVPLNQELHAGKKIKQVESIESGSRFHVSCLTLYRGGCGRLSLQAIRQPVSKLGASARLP